MTELEIAMIPSLGNYLQIWKQFVDDTFAFVLPDKIGCIVNQLNSFDENIQFTFEIEEENKLAFLGVMVIRHTNDTITQQFIGNQQTQTFLLTVIHIHQYSGRKQQLTY